MVFSDAGLCKMRRSTERYCLSLGNRLFTVLFRNTFGHNSQAPYYSADAAVSGLRVKTGFFFFFFDTCERHA